MIGLLNNIHLALPELIILVTACTALLGDLFVRRWVPSIAFLCASAGLIAAAGVNVLFLGQFSRVLLNGLFISDDIGHLMELFICITVFLSFVYSKRYLNEHRMPSGDYYVLGLFSTLGMMTLVSAHSLLTVYLGLELLSLPLYALTAMQRRNADGSEAAMKYFVMGAIASGLLLYGLSLLYGATGCLDLKAIADVVSSDAFESHRMLSYALVFIVAGIGFKLAAVPFHMWAPDVYTGAPNSVTLFISAAPKIAALSMAFRILTQSLMSIATEWQSLILVLALLSIGLGNIAAIAQHNIKRMLAYSAISHAGYALLGILAATASGFSASLYYILVYAVMSVAAFGLLVLLSKSGMDVERIDALKGLNQRNPWLAFLMMLVMLSMAGVPPMVGFFTKLLVLKALVDAELTWVAVVGLLFAVIGAYYYLRIIKVMYFDDAIETTPVRLPFAMTTVLSLNGLALLWMGLFPSALIRACMDAFL